MRKSSKIITVSKEIKARSLWNNIESITCMKKRKEKDFLYILVKVRKF